MSGIKALVIRPFDGTLSLPVDFQTTHPLGLDYPRGADEPIGGGFVAVVDGLFGYGVAIVRTGAEQLQTLDADPETLAVLVLTESEDGAKWPELNNEVTGEGLARINAVLTANGAPNLPEGISVRQALGVMAAGVEFVDFDLGEKDVAQAAAADDLEWIVGIGPSFAATLNGAGILTFSQLVAADAAAVAALFNSLVNTAKVQDWQAQAKALMEA